VLLSKEAFSDVVQGGTLVENGMPGFPELSDSALEQLRHYIRAKARGLTVGPDGTVQDK
jgi:quinohemoprotein ethanol dehydrogenase